MDQSAHHQQPQQQYVDPNQQYQQQQYQQQHQQPMDPNQQVQQHQYQPQQQMQPNQGAPPNQEWNTPLCTCSPFDGCILATCLPCILVGKTSERLVDPSLSRYETFNPECLIMGGITYIGLGFVYAMIKRMEIRERFGIKGSGAGDFCAAYCCPCCVVLQNDNEVKNRVGQPQPGPVVQGYQQNQGMAMPTPPAGKH